MRISQDISYNSNFCQDNDPANAKDAGSLKAKALKVADRWKIDSLISK
jgi:hypothetical protein